MSDEDVCRICRGEETAEDPLYHPCRCAGSIKFVHRECLLEWLQHARTASKCELCGARYTMVQRYKPNMPQYLHLSDYVFYSINKGIENIPFLFLCARGLLLVSCLGILTKYALEFSTIASNRVFYSRMMSSSWHILRERCKQDPPRRSGAPAIDWLLSFVVPASELRSAWVDGMLILTFFLFLFIMFWVITMWVLNEPAVIHDLEHISSGEISHMDNGDDDMVEFDELNNGHGNMIEGERNLAARRDQPAVRRRERPNRPERPQRGEAPPNREIYLRQNPPRQEEANEQQAFMDHLRQNGAVEPTVFHDAPNELNNAPAENHSANGAAHTESDNEPAFEFQFNVAGLNAPPNDNQRLGELEEDRQHEGGHNYIRDTDVEGDVAPSENEDEEPVEDADAQLDLPVPVDDDMALREEEEDAEELEALGFAIRGLIHEIFGGTNAETLGEFGVVAFTAIALVEFVYMIPYIIIRIYWRLVSSLLLRHIPGGALISSQLEILDSESLPIHFTVIAIHGSFGIIILRYTELKCMSYLLQRTWGVSLVMGVYQFYAILKSLLMMIIEFLVFPQFCGGLMHLVSVPLTPTMADHWNVCKQHPYLMMFAHWFTGFLYMHGIMIFVNTCRKFFRRGVLYFVHDGEAPDFIRAIVFVSVPKQIYRIGISAVLYGFLILVGMGSVTYTLSKIMPLLNIIYWPGLALLRLWPVFIFGHAYFVPLVPTGIQLNKVVSTWFREEVWLYVLRFAARSLDLDSWLFGKKRVLSDQEKTALSKNDTSFGSFVRAPQSSRFRDRKNLALFVPVDESNRRLDSDAGTKAPQLSRYTIVWRPPFFWARLCALCFIVWGAATQLILLLTLVPLCVGRILDHYVFGETIINDLLLYGAGLSLCLPLYGQMIRMYPPGDLLNNSSFRGLRGKLPTPEQRSWFQVFVWSLLFTGMQVASPVGWAHWTVVWPLSARSAVANFVVTYVAGLCASAWMNAIAVSDFMILQQILEIIGFVPHTNWYYWVAVQPVLTLILWERWCQSRQAQRWSASVRDYMYLDGTEIKNYSE